MQLSIIIPTYNEERAIGNLLSYLQTHASNVIEIIVADGGSLDATVQIAVDAGVKVLRCSQKGRGKQMNAGAAKATGDVLYFLHADTYPPINFEKDIEDALDKGFGSGCFRLRFDSAHWFLKLNAWFTRFNIEAFRFGDQSLFVRKDLFDKVQGFNEQLLVLEDQEIVSRLSKVGRFTVLPSYVTTSARRYWQVGVYTLQAGYFLIYTLYKLNIPQNKLVHIYRRLIK